jgi:hypothetical protein
LNAATCTSGFLGGREYGARTNFASLRDDAWVVYLKRDGLLNSPRWETLRNCIQNRGHADRTTDRCSAPPSTTS